MYEGKVVKQNVSARFALRGQPCAPPTGYRGPQVLAYIRQAIATDGIGPTYDRIADDLGFLTAADVCKVVTRLEKHGFVIRPGRGRWGRVKLTNAN